MRTMKKVLATVLAVAMVLTGFYGVKMDGAKVQAASDVNTEMLDVKVQTASDGANIMRFISSVDSLDYYKVGFEVTPAGGSKKTYETKYVYERISSVEDNVKYKFSPKVVDTDSEYFITAKMNASAGVDYTVRAFVITLTGETVYGQSRCVAVEDGKSNTPLNLTFETATTGIKVGDDISTTYTDSSITGNNATTTAKVIAVAGTSVTVRVDVDKEQLDSATKFTFGTAGSTIYRNLYTTHVPTSGTTPVADTTWYSVYAAEGETKFTIATSADLYGFSKLSDINQFANDYIYLVSDIEINEGTSSKDGWSPKAGAAEYNWTPISDGGATNAFNGVFDGQGHTLSGIVCKAASGSDAGLFGYADWAPTTAGADGKLKYIKNFRIENSYFCSNSDAASVVVGVRYNIANVYSSADVVGTYSGTAAANGGTGNTGGLFGFGITWNSNMSNCWFDGTVSAVNGFAGGIAGSSKNQWEMSYCFNTGEIYAAPVNSLVAGGFIGSRTNNKALALTNSVSAGTITTSGAGSVTKADFVAQNASGTASIYENNYTLVSSASSEWVKGTAVTAGITYKAAGTVKGYDGLNMSNLNFSYWTTRKNDIPALRMLVDDSEATLDTTWYDTEKTTYKISDAADLYGLAYLSHSNTFAGKTVKITKDIVVNANTPDTIAEWKTYVTNNTLNKWVYCIGSASSQFAGTLDGQGNTISGIYMNATIAERGFCGYLGENGTIQNLRLVDSYLTTSKNCIGGIAAVSYGDIKNVYTNACVVSTANSQEAAVGGMVGIFGGAAANTMTISNCWFDGSVEAIGMKCSNFVAEVKAGTVTMNHCLNTGNLEVNFGNIYNGARSGGLFGLVTNATNVVINISDTLNAGTMALGTKDNSSQSGTVIGFCGYSAKVTASNTYATTKKITLAGVANSDWNIIYGSVDSGAVTDLTGVDITGEKAKTNTALDFTNYWKTVEGSTPILKTFQ